MSDFSYRAIGHHGCPASRASKVEQDGVEAWERSAGWLGAGIYFWDNDPSTGEWWAKHHYGDRGPTVIRAELDLSNALDLSNVFGQNALKRLRRLADDNPQTKAKLEELREDGFSTDGALLHLARSQFESDSGKDFTSLRAPLHMNEAVETMEKVPGTDLLASFRLAIVVYQPSIIGEYEVNHVG